MDAASLELVRKLPLFSSLSSDQLGCLDGGEIIRFATGDLLASEGDPAEYFIVNMEGSIRLHRVYDSQDVLMGVSSPGSFMGELPILLDSPWMATARAACPVTVFRLGKDDFWRMMSECHSVAREVLRAASTRLRNMEGYSQKREKLASLGTMAAGLAHELNNPAAAAQRAAAHLNRSVEEIQGHVCQLSQILDHDQWQDLLNAGFAAIDLAGKVGPMSSVIRSDCEECLSEWLEKRGIADGWKLAPTFVAAGLDYTWLGALLDKLPKPSESHALAWLESRLALKSLLGEIEQSTSRIAELVKAVKSYSHMDESPNQEVNIQDGIESTLTILRHKLKNVTIERDYAPSLPKILAYGSELNQVWTNLIDNAIDAVKATGKISIKTCFDGTHIIVEIADNGPGIPKSVQARMFEPFFTTKGVGSGTGLGLVISNRIVADRHGGEIEFQSQPGETRFKISIPVNRVQPTPRQVDAVPTPAT